MNMKPILFFVAVAIMGGIGPPSAADEDGVEQCATVIEQAVCELRPDWSEDLRCSLVAAVRQALKDGAQIPPLRGKLDAISSEMPVLLCNLPASVPPDQEDLTVEKVRWYVAACVARPEEDYHTAAMRKETIRQQIAALVERMVDTISRDVPHASRNEVLLAADRCHQRCLELAERELAPILKVPMQESDLEKVFGDWEAKTRPQREAISGGGSAAEVPRDRLRAICGAMVGSIWTNASPSHGALTAAAGIASMASEQAINASLAAQSTIEARFGTKLENVEHWGNVLQFVFSAVADPKDAGVQDR